MSACFPDGRCHATSARKISPFRCSPNGVRSCAMTCPTARQREYRRTQIDRDQFSVTAIEESADYSVTRSKEWGPVRKIRKVIFRHLDEAPARRFYKRTPPAPGYIIALCRPDGTLIASTNGLAQPAS